jgi:hypothetical protein
MAIHTLSTFLPTIQVELRVPKTSIAHGRGGEPITGTALVDTGATITAVSPAVMRALNPSPFGTALYHPRGQVPAWIDTYLAILVIETATDSGRTFALEIIEEQPVTPGVDILLGHVLLMRVIMVWDGPRDRLILTY